MLLNCGAEAKRLARVVFLEYVTHVTLLSQRTTWLSGSWVAFPYGWPWFLPEWPLFSVQWFSWDMPVCSRLQAHGLRPMACSPVSSVTLFVCWIASLAVPALCCCTGLSLVAVSRRRSSCDVQASHCRGFSRRRARAVEFVDSGVGVPGL